MTIQNKVQLITYPDSLGNNLPELHYVLQKYLKEAIGGVHILPFYPSSADRGFTPLTYEKVDPNFGTWEDIEKIGNDFDLIIDFIVNHISKQSVFFQDYIKNGDSSEYADMFISLKKLSPDGYISKEDLAKVYTRKPSDPFTVIERSDGSKEKIWCTFDYQQIDLNWQSSKTREIFRKFLLRLSRTNAKLIRIDAFAYTITKIGTNCFFIEPDVWELLEWLNGFTTAFDTEILPEVHEHYSYQLKIAKKGYWTYDFALPLLVLHTLYHHTNKRLIHWLNICPRKQVTTLDTHDGIGVVDVAGLMSKEEINRTINGLYEKGSNVKRIYSGPDYQNLDIFQVNCTYFSALDCNENSYIAARTIQFFAPGVPQVYYVGLLAGENDTKLVEQTHLGRNINRHNYDLNEINTEIQKPVVQRLLKLMKFRSTYPAFNGSFKIEDSQENRLILTWMDNQYKTKAFINLENYNTKIIYYDAEKGSDCEFIV